MTWNNNDQTPYGAETSPAQANLFGDTAPRPEMVEATPRQVGELAGLAATRVGELEESQASVIKFIADPATIVFEQPSPVYQTPLVSAAAQPQYRDVAAATYADLGQERVVNNARYEVDKAFETTSESDDDDFLDKRLKHAAFDKNKYRPLDPQPEPVNPILTQLDQVYLESHGTAPFDAVQTGETETAPSFYPVKEAGMANPEVSSQVDYVEQLQGDVAASDTAQPTVRSDEVQTSDALAANAREWLEAIYGKAA